MSPDKMRVRVLNVLEAHALAAQASQYDRRVAVTAISTARAHIEEILAEGSAEAYGNLVLAALASQLETYNDPDGVYTNGRGVIGSLLGDLAVVIKKDALR